MAEVVGTGVVEVVPDTRKFGAALSAQTNDVTKGLARAGGPLAKLNQTVSDFGVSSTFAFAAAGAAAIGFAASSVRAYEEHQTALTALTNSLQNAPQIIDKSTKAFEDQATALQNVTGFQDEEIISADAVLARFGSTREEITKLNPLILDYARASGTDAATAAGKLGRAVLGNAKALKEIGIKYTATGDRAQDFANITALLEQQVGGAAEAFGKTFAGQVEILNAKFDDLKETIGGALMPVLGDLATMLTTVVDGLNKTIGALGGSGGLGTVLEKVFQAATHEMSAAFGLLGAFGDLLHGHFVDAAKEGANALIPFWDPFKVDTAEATQQMQDASRTMTLVGSNADAYASHINSAAQQSANLSDETKALRDRVLAMKPASQVGTDAISGLKVQLYDADAAMRAFIHSIDVYLGKIKSPGLNFRVPTGQVPIRKQAGGVVPGGYGGGDIVPALLEPGEVVIPKEQARGMSGMAGVTLVFHGPVYGLDDFENRIGAAVAQVFAKAAR